MASIMLFLFPIDGCIMRLVGMSLVLRYEPDCGELVFEFHVPTV